MKYIAFINDCLEGSKQFYFDLDVKPYTKRAVKEAEKAFKKVYGYKPHILVLRPL